MKLKFPQIETLCFKKLHQNTSAEIMKMAIPQ